MLTTRETQVLELIARGHSDRRVAATLAIALSTARKHRENLQRKLGLHKAPQLVLYYLERAPPRRRSSCH